LTYRIREVPVTFSLACPQIQFLVELADLLVIVGVLPKREEAVVDTFELRGQVGPALFSAMSNWPIFTPPISCFRPVHQSR
jgi:hypothetical protein